MHSKVWWVALSCAVACAKPALHKHVDVSEATELAVTQSGTLAPLLEGQNSQSVVAVLRDEEQQIVCSDLTLCTQRVLPASTYKVPNALIGLETGVIADADFVIPWDGVTREFEPWNHDHTLRTAIAASVVPYFQELARRVGPQREAEWLHKLHYGNEQAGAPQQVDTFWLEGPLAISPSEQISFLRRLARGQLPLSARSQEIVRDIIKLDEHDGTVLRGKTGWGQPHTDNEVGWFIGYSERGTQRTYVAVLLRHAANMTDEAFLAARRSIAERALQQQGMW